MDIDVALTRAIRGVDERDPEYLPLTCPWRRRQLRKIGNRREIHDDCSTRGIPYEVIVEAAVVPPSLLVTDTVPSVVIGFVKGRTSL